MNDKLWEGNTQDAGDVSEAVLGESIQKNSRWDC